MRAFITGATGFVGGRLAERLRERGDDVVCLVRSPGKARPLEALGCTLVAGDLRDADAIKRGMEGCDAVFHVAADYRVGLRPSSHDSMTDSNVGGTTRVLDAARSTAIPRSITAAAEVAALASLDAESELLERVTVIAGRRDSLVARLREAGWPVPDAQGNFVWLLSLIHI